MDWGVVACFFVMPAVGFVAGWFTGWNHRGLYLFHKQISRSEDE